MMMQESNIKLIDNNQNKEYEFIKTDLVFHGEVYQDVFAHKNNKNVAETLQHRRYAKFADAVKRNYSASLHKPLGEFLLELKKKEDNFYKNFLNKYGDLTYSIFTLASQTHFDSTGIYAYRSGDQLNYIGRCKDSMKKRINQGYGKIHPKNCYLDGQATNCHLNNLITKTNDTITLWLCELESPHEIETAERNLINAYNPPWNLQK